MRNIWGSKMDVLPEELGSICPTSEWCWEPLKIESRVYVEVVSVEKRTDGDWWILTKAIRPGAGLPKGHMTWNPLSRFVEAAVITRPAGPKISQKKHAL